MTTVININRALIFEGISKITGFIGKNVENGLDRIAVTEDEKNIIDDLIRSSIISMTAFVSAYHPVLNDNGITIETPSNFDRAASEALQSEMETYIINQSCYNWFHIAREENDAGKYSEYAKNNILNINLLLSRRTRPQRI